MRLIDFMIRGVAYRDDERQFARSAPIPN